ncbi:MAG: FAD/FMN-containing dehydrogenase [Gammaproteobacteria bacterium]
MSSFVFPYAEISTACQLVDDLSARVSRDVNLILGITAASVATADSNGATASVLGVAFVNTSDEACALLAPLNDDPRVKRALTSTINAASDLNGLHGAVGAALSGGYRYEVDNIWSNQPLATVLEGMAEVYTTAPSMVSNIMVPCFHPEFSLDSTAHSMWGRNLVYQYAIWTDPETDVAIQSWHADVMARLDPHMVGRYVGEADLTRSSESARECYAPEAWERLRTLRGTYDPEGLFFDYLGMA